ncbi:MAG: hypothetical protein JW939_07875 [Candidatus Thermoplasmatota archaeon]|nr:hypothetical protein [Candidatus Thermoplasmatota archaeon]
MMWRPPSFLIASTLVMFLLPIHTLAQETIITYEDEGSDFIRYGDATGHEDDIDILKVTCDDSSFPIVVEMTVKGTVTGSYGDGGTNKYVILLDLDGDESLAELSFQLNESGHVTIYTEDRSFPYPEEDYTISGSKMTIRIDYSYMGNYEKVSDLAVSTLQRFSSPAITVTDSLNYLFGEDNAPFPRGDPPDDDITTDDDSTDDDEQSVDDDDKTPGFSIAIAIFAAFVSVVLMTRKRKDR